MRATPTGMVAGEVGAVKLTLSSAARLPASTNSGSLLANSIDWANSMPAIEWLPCGDGAGDGAGAGAGLGAAALGCAGAGSSEPPQAISAAAAEAANRACSEGLISSR
jgi:hypothetical protein